MERSEVKSKVKKMWDTIWTGGISSPITVLEQITYLMFMKLLDDIEITKEGSAAALGVTYQSNVFKEGNFVVDESHCIPYKELRWSSFQHKSPDELFGLIRDYVFPFIKTVNGEGKETAFSNFMKDAIFLIPTAKVLGVCVDIMSEIDMTNNDVMGDTYEYALSLMSSAGTLGQFRTPRHIIDMMVRLVEPNLDDVICDPAMGSAGFLLGCAKYVQEKYKVELHNKEKLKHFQTEMFNGYDTDPSMLRIGAMNMLLHDVDDPIIKRQDSLSSDNTIRNEYSLIMANPPFTGNVFEEDISKDILAVGKTKKTELLFLTLFIKSLKLGGRCACIVPDGVLFGKTKGHISIKKELVDNNKLEAVISMPSGVFKPYTGESTYVLIFKKDPSGTEDVWFYDMKADGFSLDDKRNKITENNIPDIINRFHNLDNEKQRTRKEQSFFVNITEIQKNEYDLSINKYKEFERINIKYRDTSEIVKEIENLQISISDDVNDLRMLLKGDVR